MRNHNEVFFNNPLVSALSRSSNFDICSKQTWNWSISMRVEVSIDVTNLFISIYAKDGVCF